MDYLVTVHHWPKLDNKQPPVQFRFAYQTLTVAELIRLTVLAEIASMQAATAAQQAIIKARLQRQYLTEEDIAAQAQSGVIRLPKDQDDAPIDVEKEIKKAWQAFEKKKFIINLQGVQPQTLQDQVLLLANTEVTFIRLMRLVGG